MKAAPGSGFASGRLLQQGGRNTGSNCIPATPIELSWGEGYVPRWRMPTSQDARRPIIAASPVVFQLGTSPFRRPPKRSGGAAAVHGRRVGQFGRRPKIPLDPPRGLVNEARPARLLPDRGGHRVQERRSPSGLDRPAKLKQQIQFLVGKMQRHGEQLRMGAHQLMTPGPPRTQEADAACGRGTRSPPRRSA
jgi:hypothetical protein